MFGARSRNIRKAKKKYDANGNLTAKSAVDDDDEQERIIWVYEYDPGDRLIKASGINGNGTQTVVSFKYDPFDRRIGKMIEEIKNGLCTVLALTSRWPLNRVRAPISIMPTDWAALRT